MKEEYLKNANILKMLGKDALQVGVVWLRVWETRITVTTHATQTLGLSIQVLPRAIRRPGCTETAISQRHHDARF
jgi:hypothetical protein